MGDPVRGKSTLLSIMGANEFVVIEHQEEITFSTGRTQERVRTKTGTLTYQVEEGESLSFTFRKLRPLSAGQNLLYAAHDSNDLVDLKLEDSKTGGHVWTGQARITITEETLGVDDIVVANVSAIFEGDVARTVST